MTFEEEFPSLKGRMCDVTITFDSFYNDLQQTCLDRQKVKEIIDKLSSVQSEVSDLVTVGRQNALDDLCQELGL